MPTKSDIWEKRQQVIRKILAREAIASQDELLVRLAAQGFEVTQSSVSRDLAELGAFKREGRYVTERALPELPVTDLFDEVAQAIQSVTAAGPHLLVVKTPPGLAPAVSAAIDQWNTKDVAGTVAGDDTLFVAVTGKREQKRVQALLVRCAKGVNHGQ